MESRSPISRINANPALNKSLRVMKRKKELQECLLWGSINIVLLSIIIYDLRNTCPFYRSTLQYCEYAAAFILSINVAYRFIRFLYLYFTLERSSVVIQKPTNAQQQKEASSTSTPNVSMFRSSSYMPTPSPMNMKTGSYPGTPTNYGGTPMNTTALSWRSYGESPNLSMTSNSWIYNQGASSPQGITTTPPRAKPRDTSGIDEIKNEDMLKKYLDDYERNDKELNTQMNVSQEQGSTWLSSFWNYPTSKTADNSSILRRNEYQMSRQSPVATKSPNADPNSSPMNQSMRGMEAWRKLQVDPRSLTQWNENLRKWLSQTILDRLVSEITNVDEALQNCGLSDVAVGQVGLERLRKTAQMAPVIQNIPTLSALIPFLELTPNQEYLVKRIKQLQKGGCMSEFKWNGGGKFQGKEWDNNLPTDSAIIMHLFASYMDTQLMPSPNKPDAKPFSTFHYIKVTEKNVDISQYTMAIQEAALSPPHFRVVVGSEVFEIVKGYNNLFHSILLFLYHVNKNEHGMLGQVNLGKAGLNMLWIINS